MTALPPNGLTSPARRAAIAACALVAFAGSPARAEDLPSPDAMALGARVIPAALVEGYRAGIGDDALDRAIGGRVPAVERPAVRARARAAILPLLDEVFPPELLAGLGAQFLAAHYTGDELRTLRQREDSALGLKVRDFEQRAAEIIADSPAAHDRARAALARATFSAAEQRELEAFQATPLGAKGLALAADLAAFFVDALDRRYRSVRQELDPRLRRAIEATLPAP